MVESAIIREIEAANLLLSGKRLAHNNDLLLSWQGSPLSSYSAEELSSSLDLAQLSVLNNQLQKLVQEGTTQSVCVLSDNDPSLLACVPITSTTDVALFGLGRIGRLLIRLAAFGYSPILNIRCIVVRKGDWHRRLSLITRDSVHGRDFTHSFIDESGEIPILHYGSLECFLIEADSPQAVDYHKLGLENVMVIDNTGVFKDRGGLSGHLQAAGASSVLLTAPGKDIPNVVLGVNDNKVFEEKQEHLLSAASCTTNATAPLLDFAQQSFGIEHCHFETIHSYTNDQMLVDSYHNNPRRSRAASENIVISTTGASAAIAQILPELNGKISGNAIRIPTPNVSLVSAAITLEKAITVEEFNTALMSYSSAKPWLLALDTDDSAASKDYVGSRSAVTVDIPACQINGKHIVVYGWYDNEFGYACQVLRLACAWKMSAQYSISS